MFSEEEIREFREDGLTDEQIELLSGVMDIADTVEMLPNDIEGLVREYESRVPADTIEGMKAICEMIQKDPEMFQQIVALDLVLSNSVNLQSKNEQQKTFVTELSDEEYKIAHENFFKTISELSEEDKISFLKLLENITEEQKKDMVSRLTRK